MNELLRKNFQRLIADYSNVSSKEVKDISIIFSFPYTDEVYDKLMSVNDKDEIAEIDEDKDGTSLDNLFVCEFLLGAKKGLAIIFDPCELYDPTRVKRIII